MKTSVTMVRKMGGLNVHQRTKDGMFDATFLAKQWNSLKSNRRKDVSNFLNNKGTIEFMEALSERTGIDTRNLVTVFRGKNQGTWMHPYLFIKFSMWINPKFEVSVIMFVYDELIQQRHFAGDNYVKLSSIGARLKGYNFPEVATALNWIVFNSKGKGMRQKASQDQLKELNELQSNLAFSIEKGYIKTYQQLLFEMRKIWREKRNRSPF